MTSRCLLPLTMLASSPTGKTQPGSGRFAAGHARRVGLPPHRVADLTIAVSELTANTYRHSSADGLLSIWAAAGEVICQIEDSGHITDPLVGRHHPAPDAGGGHGMWVIHQVCDLVEPRTGTAGTVIRLHMSCNR